MLTLSNSLTKFNPSNPDDCTHVDYRGGCIDVCPGATAACRLSLTLCAVQLDTRAVLIALPTPCRLVARPARIGLPKVTSKIFIGKSEPAPSCHAQICYVLGIDHLLFIGGISVEINIEPHIPGAEWSQGLCTLVSHANRA